MSFWRKNGVLVGNANGKLITCDKCPCDASENVVLEEYLSYPATYAQQDECGDDWGCMGNSGFTKKSLLKGNISLSDFKNEKITFTISGEYSYSRNPNETTTSKTITLRKEAGLWIADYLPIFAMSYSSGNLCFGAPSWGGIWNCSGTGSLDGTGDIYLGQLWNGSFTYDAYEDDYVPLCGPLLSGNFSTTARLSEKIINNISYPTGSQNCQGSFSGSFKEDYNMCSGIDLLGECIFYSKLSIKL